MIKYYENQNGSFRIVDNLKKKYLVLVENITKHDLDEISKITGLHLRNFHDVVDEYEVPRIVKKDKNTIVFLRTPETDKSGLHTETLTFIVNPDHLVVLSPDTNHLFKYVLEQRQDIHSNDLNEFLLSLFVVISERFTENVRKVRGKVLSHKEDIYSINSDTIEDLVEIEEILNQYLYALIPMKHVFATVFQDKHMGNYNSEAELYEQLLNSITQSVEVCTVNLKSIKSIRDSYQIIFTNKLNKSIQFFTALTVILTIPMIITSVYGMNLNLPYQYHPDAFEIVVGLSSLIALVALLIFFVKKWL